MKKTVSALLILVLIVIFWPSDSTQLDDGSSISRKIQSGAHSELQKTELENSRSTRVIQEQSEKKTQDDEVRPYEDWELSKILSHFMVPPGEFEVGDINASIARLKAIYREYSGHELAIALTASAQTNEIISFEHDNISFRTLLGMVAGMSGYSVAISQHEIALTKIKPRPRRSGIETSSPLALSEEAREKILNTPEKTREYLSSLGLHLTEGFEFPNDPQKLENLINSLQDARLDPENTQKQVAITHKFISFPPGFEFKAMHMSTAELQAAIQDWSQIEGFNVGDLPGVIAMPGKNATMAILRDVTYPDAQSQDQFVTESVGWEISTTPILAGLNQNQLENDLDISTVDPVNRDQLSRESIQRDIALSEIPLNDGDHFLIPMTGDDGITTVQIISSRRTDHTGRRLWPPQPE